TIHVQSLLRSKLHGHWRCANELNNNWISIKATPRENDFIVSGGVGVNQLLEQCRGTGAERSLIKRNDEMLRKCSAQFHNARIWVAVHSSCCLTHSLGY